VNDAYSAARWAAENLGKLGGVGSSPLNAVKKASLRT
jgi:hypothetical protein